jgi:hypothetical protein|tara:strand:- start:1561 stop:2025 length:465 start_codon:yes stop_codon:yes gene_type:complete
MYVLGITASATAASIPDFALGTIGANVTSDGIKVYKYIKYDTGGGSVAAVASQVAYYYTLDGYKNHTVTSDLSDSVEIGAGVLQSAPGDGEYGWIQIKGPATLNLALTAGADGDPLTPTGSSDGTLDVSAAVTDNVCAIAGDISDKEVACDFPL